MIVLGLNAFRSDAAARVVVEDTFGVPCVALALVDPSFYHLDTAFCALPCGAVLYHPGAFTPAALEEIHRRVPPEQRIALDKADAGRFAANAVAIGAAIVMSWSPAGTAAFSMTGSTRAGDAGCQLTPRICAQILPCASHRSRSNLTLVSPA